MLILTWKMKNFQFLHPSASEKPERKSYLLRRVFFGIRAYLRYFQIVMRTQTSDLRTKSGRSSLFPLQGHSVLPKGSEMSPDSEKDDLWIRWSVLSFRMRNASRKLRVIYCFYLQSIWKASKMIKIIWIFAPKIILHFLDKNNSSKWSKWQDVNKFSRFFVILKDFSETFWVIFKHCDYLFELTFISI